MSSLPPIIAWDYQFAPNAQKSRNYLYATNTPFKISEQPFFIPRPILRNIGITYRRVPILSIGKDVFPDNASFLSALQSLLEPSGKGLVRRSDDHAYDTWGYRSFWVILPCVPSDLNNEQLQKDRKDLFPLFGRKDYARLQKNAASELRALMDVVENEFLSAGGPWIGGEKCGMADIHAMWMIKWALKTIRMEEREGLGREEFPKVYKWIESLPQHDESLEKNDKLSEKESHDLILGSEYAMPEIGVDGKDPLQLIAGQEVYVEPTDADPGAHPQSGRLCGLSTKKVVIELDNGIRLHFPRVGYIVHSAEDEEGKSVLQKARLQL